MIFKYIVTIECDTEEQAEQVILERIDYEEDYGFRYRITESRCDATQLEAATTEEDA